MRWNDTSFNKWVGYCAAFLIVFVIQTSCGRFITVFGVKPNLLLCMVVCTAMHEGKYMGALLGFAAGWLADALVSYIRGYYTFIFTAGGAFIGYISQFFIRVIPINAALITALYDAAFNIVFYILFFIMPGRGGWDAAAPVILTECLATALLSVPFFYICRAISRLARADEEE